MSDGGVLSVGFNRSDLNLDISRAVDAQGKLDYAKSLASYYPARSLTPREYAATHMVARRVEFRYVGPGGEAPESCPAGCDLLAVVGVGFTRRECEDVEELLSSAAAGERVIVGIPLQAMSGTAQIKELVALDELAASEPYNKPGAAQELLDARRQALKRQLVERLRKGFAPSGFRWIYQGKVLEEAPAGNRNAFFSGVLQFIYNQSPEIKLAGSRRERREAVAELLDFANPLQLARSGRLGSARVLREMLGDTGALSVLEDCGGYVSYTVNPDIDNTSKLGPVCRMLSERLVGDGLHNITTSASEILKTLYQAPWGLGRVGATLVLAVTFRRFFPDLVLLQDGEYLPVSGVSLGQLLNNPGGWQISYHVASEDEGAFLAAVIDMFKPSAEAAATHHNPWEAAKKAVLNWFKQLPKIVHAGAVWPGETSQVLAGFLSDNAKCAIARDMFGIHLPELRGEMGIPLIENQADLLAWLRQGKEELEGLVAYRQTKLALEIGKLFGGSEAPSSDVSGWLESLYQRWVKRLHPGTSEAELSVGARAVLELANSDKPFAEKWFEVLPAAFGLAAVPDWSPDCGDLYLAKLLRARMELELWRIRQLFPMPEDPELASEKLVQWMNECMEGLGVTNEQRQSVLLDLLEDLCWQ